MVLPARTGELSYVCFKRKFRIPAEIGAHLNIGLIFDMIIVLPYHNLNYYCRHKQINSSTIIIIAVVLLAISLLILFLPKL